MSVNNVSVGEEPVLSDRDRILVLEREMSEVKDSLHNTRGILSGLVMAAGLVGKAAHHVGDLLSNLTPKQSQPKPKVEL